MKKIFLAIVFTVYFISFSFGAKLTLSPSEWYLSENCIESFKVLLNMEPWDKAITLDLVVRSNMEFVKFENWNLFKYDTPPYLEWDMNSIMLFNDRWWEITEWWFVWTLYYKTTWVSDPYLEYYFVWEWETIDTNVNIDWKDILKSVKSWKYEILKDKECLDPAWAIINVWNMSYDQQMDEFVKIYKKDHSWKIINFLVEYCWYICCCILLILIIVLVAHKIQKKW